MKEQQFAYVMRTRNSAVALWLSTVSVAFFAASIITYLYAESAWAVAGTTDYLGKESVGVGTSAYDAIGFQRSIVLGILGCGAALLAIPLRTQTMREELVTPLKPLSERWMFYWDKDEPTPSSDLPKG